MISFYIVFIFIGIVIFIIDDINGTSIDLESSSANLLLRLAGMILYGVYMGTIEAATGGRSLGKLFTKTKAVQLSNNPLRLKKHLVEAFLEWYLLKFSQALEEIHGMIHGRAQKSLK